MKKYLALSLLSLCAASVAQAEKLSCMDTVKVGTRDGSVLVELDRTASESIFSKAKDAEIRTGMMAGRSGYIGDFYYQTLRNSSLVCCRLAKVVKPLPKTEQCKLAVRADGSLGEVDFSVLK